MRQSGVLQHILGEIRNISAEKDTSSGKHAYVILTPLNPLSYCKTGVYRGTHYFSYFCSKHRLWVLVRTASLRRSNEYPQSIFEQKYEKYENFLSENFHFLVVKFSVYLNRHVFVMSSGAMIPFRDVFNTHCFIISQAGYIVVT